MTVEEHRRLDEATVWMCEQTSIRTPRDVLADCAHCSQPFWSRNRGRYCRDTCRSARWYDVHVVRPRQKRVEVLRQRFLVRAA